MTKAWKMRILAVAMAAGGMAITYGSAASAAPLSTATIAVSPGAAPLIEQAQYYGYRHRYYRPRYYHPPRYYAPRHRYYAPRYYAPRRHYRY